MTVAGPLVILDEHWQLVLKIFLRAKPTLCSWLIILSQKVSPAAINNDFFQMRPVRKAGMRQSHELQTNDKGKDAYKKRGMPHEGENKQKIVL